MFRRLRVPSLFALGTPHQTLLPMISSAAWAPEGEGRVITSHVVAVSRVLTAAPASVCRTRQELISFPANTPCAEVLAGLNRAGITGAPVYKATKDPAAMHGVRAGGAWELRRCFQPTPGAVWGVGLGGWLSLGIARCSPCGAHFRARYASPVCVCVSVCIARRGDVAPLLCKPARDRLIIDETRVLGLGVAPRRGQAMLHRLRGCG